jgi:hypothetical protein
VLMPMLTSTADEITRIVETLAAAIGSVAGQDNRPPTADPDPRETR